MAAKIYWEKLQDVRWQRKRLEILERDGWRCCLCGDTSNTLHVDHGYYESKKDPWEYENDTLAALCKSCHEEIGELRSDAHREIAILGPGALTEISELLFCLRRRASREEGLGKATWKLMWCLGGITGDHDTWKWVRDACFKPEPTRSLDSDIAIGAGCGA